METGVLAVQRWRVHPTANTREELAAVFSVRSARASIRKQFFQPSPSLQALALSLGWTISPDGFACCRS